MIKYTVMDPFFTLLPCLYQLTGTDNKIRTIKKLKIYALFLCFREHDVGSSSHFIIKAESQEESSIIYIKIVCTCAIVYHVTTILCRSLVLK